jgi:[ribosomal protein S18]-alanine N-acetyltransferase
LGTLETLMNYEIQAISLSDAQSIAEWQYEGVYSFYDTKADKEDYEELMNPATWGKKYYSVKNDQGTLVGYFSFDKKGEYIELGLAMSPEQVGKGNGVIFVKAGVEFIKDKFPERKILLSVASFNKRAIKVYKRVGFKYKDNYSLNCNDKEYEFMRMELEINT